jgi:hypothetical protein
MTSSTEPRARGRSSAVGKRYTCSLGDAEALHVSPETVMREWNMAKLWLLREMKSGE